MAYVFSKRYLVQKQHTHIERATDFTPYRKQMRSSLLKQNYPKLLLQVYFQIVGINKQIPSLQVFTNQFCFSKMIITK